MPGLPPRLRGTGLPGLLLGPLSEPGVPDEEAARSAPTDVLPLAGRPPGADDPNRGALRRLRRTRGGADHADRPGAEPRRAGAPPAAHRRPLDRRPRVRPVWILHPPDGRGTEDV